MNNSFLHVHNIELINLNELLNSCRSISYRLEENYIRYLKKYHGEENFTNLSCRIELNNNFAICPITLQKVNENNYLNFYTQPIEIFIKNPDDPLLKKEIINYFLKLFKKHNIKDKIFKIKYNSSNLDNLNKKIFIKKIFDVYIDLRQEIDEISKNFKQSIRTILKKNYDDLKYEIIDSKNYSTNDIIEMRDLHIKISGKETRSIETWLINEEMIKDGNAFLVKITRQGKPISFSFFYLNKTTCIYFSSCSFREYFTTYKNLTHKSIFYAIKYAKEHSCKNIYLGFDEKPIELERENSPSNLKTFIKNFSKEYDEYFLTTELREDFDFGRIV
jgi:hypothetical protein